MSAGPGSGVVEVGDYRLAYDAAGSGPETVLFLHPGLWDRRTWDGTFERFAERYRVIRYDARGYGGSPASTSPFSPSADAVAVLDALEVTRAHVVGCSMGGAAAIDMAVEFPSRVGSLVLAAPGLDGHRWAGPTGADAQIDEGIEAALKHGDLDRVVELGLKLWIRCGVDDPIGRRVRQIALDNTGSWLLDESLERHPDPRAATRLHEISVPTLILLGDNDYPEMAVIAERLERELPTATLVRVAGADHVINMRTPQVFDREVLAFLSRAATTVSS